MRTVQITALIAYIMLLIACGDDSSSAGDAYTYTVNFSLVVDEANHLLVLNPDSYPVDRCVSEGDALVWKTVVHRNKPDSLRYEFHEDSLYLYDIGSDGNASIFLGGHAGSIYGTWKYTFCKYNGQGGEVQCSEEDKRRFKYEINFSEGRVAANYEIYYDKILEEEKANDYMESYFMYWLYNRLSSKCSHKRVYVGEISFSDVEAVQEAIQKCGVQVIEKTKNGGTFMIDEKTYTLMVNKDNMIFQTDEYEPYEEHDIDLEVSDGVTICKVHYVRSNLVREQCRVEYAKYMNLTTGLDDSGNEYSYAREIEIENEDEFNKCLEEIAAKGTVGSVDPLYKKSAKSGMGIEKNIDRNILKLLKYAKN